MTDVARVRLLPEPTGGTLSKSAATLRWNLKKFKNPEIFLETDASIEIALIGSEEWKDTDGSLKNGKILTVRMPIWYFVSNSGVDLGNSHVSM